MSDHVATIERVLALPEDERDTAADVAIEALGYSSDAKTYRARLSLIKGFEELGLGIGARFQRDLKRGRARRAA